MSSLLELIARRRRASASRRLGPPPGSGMETSEAAVNGRAMSQGLNGSHPPALNGTESLNGAQVNGASHAAAADAAAAELDSSEAVTAVHHALSPGEAGMSRLVWPAHGGAPDVADPPDPAALPSEVEEPPEPAPRLHRPLVTPPPLYESWLPPDHEDFIAPFRPAVAEPEPAVAEPDEVEHELDDELEVQDEVEVEDDIELEVEDDIELEVQDQIELEVQDEIEIELDYERADEPDTDTDTGTGTGTGTGPQGPEAGAQPAPAPRFVERGRMRRRARYLRRLREVQIRDIGGFELELHRFDRSRPEVLRAKIENAAQTDSELRALELALDDEVPLREPGIGGACAGCGAVHGSEDRFCASCGQPLQPQPGR